MTDVAIDSADVANAEQAARATDVPHASYVDEHWTLVSDLPPADDANFSDEEVEYITVDLGDTLPEEALGQLGSFQMTDLTTGEPFIRVGNEFLRGRHETLLGSALLFVQPPADPETTKQPLLQLLGASQSRMAFEDVQLIPKVKGTFIPGHNQQRASEYLFASGKGTRGARKPATGAARIAAAAGRGKGRGRKAGSMDVDDPAGAEGTSTNEQPEADASATAAGDTSTANTGDTSTSARGKGRGRGTRTSKTEHGAKTTRGGTGRAKKRAAATSTTEPTSAPAESPSLPAQAGETPAVDETFTAAATAPAASAAAELMDVEEFDMPTDQIASESIDPRLLEMDSGGNTA